MGKIIPAGKIGRLLDPSQKMFEGEYVVTIYTAVIVSQGYCFHCRSRSTFEMPITPGQSKQLEYDLQYRKNMEELAVENLEKHHQCGLMSEGKHLISDFERDLQARPRITLD